jgi:hypothetical protein
VVRIEDENGKANGSDVVDNGVHDDIHIDDVSDVSEDMTDEDVSEDMTDENE